jgi:prepilin-type N-terminal cleavage/methylation domain-containing protein
MKIIKSSMSIGLIIQNPESKIQNGMGHGFTLVETLIAMLVVSIMMTAITPVVILAVGNRVQARRVELATQAARTYINGIAAGSIEPPKHAVELDEVDQVDKQKNFTSKRAIFAGVEPPSTTGSLSCLRTTEGNSYCSNTSTSSLYCVDLDSDGCSNNSSNDLVVQAFRSVTSRSRGQSATSSAKNADDKSYLLGLRIYRADAFSDNTPLVKSDPEKKRVQMTFSGGVGDRQAPLVETTTEIVTDKATLQDFCDRLGGCQ